MKEELRVVGVCGGEGGVVLGFKDKVIGNIEGRGVFDRGKEEEWKGNLKGIGLLKGYELGKDWDGDIILCRGDCGSW